MKILTVIGARPQFIKASMFSKAVKLKNDVEEVIIHTGQHYDDHMSAVFFDQLKLPQPDYDLGVGSGSHGQHIGKMVMKLEEMMLSIKPDVVLVYGDTNSTLAGALAASGLHIPVAHVEAGLRSFNKKMPEERNRVLTDHLADWLFCPSKAAVENLKREGISKRVYLTGDIMYDSLLHYKSHAFEQSTILKALSLSRQNYYLATIHRAENTDHPERLKSILTAIRQLSLKVVLPLHPRTKQKISAHGLDDMLKAPMIHVVAPLNYFDMLRLASEAKAILTDSGGVQKEAYMLKVPCVTVRDETEWEETVQAGWNRLVQAEPQKIVATVKSLQVPASSPTLFGDGNTAENICDILMKTPRERQ